jgi:hypothetical protein
LRKNDFEAFGIGRQQRCGFPKFDVVKSWKAISTRLQIC